MRAVILLCLFASNVYAQDLYIIQDHKGSITLTSKKPKKGARYRLVKDKVRHYSYRAPKPVKSSHAHLIEAVARRFEMDPNLVKAVIHAESAFKSSARSHKGAMGLMQLMPGTAKELGVQDPYHPLENIWGGVKYLSEMLKRFDGNLKLALAAYNAGPNAVEKYNYQIPPYKETQNYVKKVLELKRLYAKETS